MSATDLDRSLVLEAVRVTEAAAIAAWKLVGRGDEKAADQAAVDAMRQALNAYIRTGGAFDSVVDFDKVIQDPANPRQFKDGYNNTDKLHPNDAGYKAMADAVDLSIFASKPARR